MVPRHVISRIAWFALALALALPAISSSARALAVSCFLVEFLSDGRLRPLSALTSAPRVEPLAVATERGRPVPADLYLGPRALVGSGLVLVHGLAATGKDEPRLRLAAGLLARLGWVVAVPTVDGLTRLRLRPEDAETVKATVTALRGAGREPVALIGVSLGAGPALLAAADLSADRAISAVLALGGYASTVEVLRYALTGAYGFGEIRGSARPDEAAIAMFARANAELVDETGRRLLENRDPRAFDGLLAALPPHTRGVLAGLDPEARVQHLGASLFLVHGRSDPAVPFTESLRLEAAARRAGRSVHLAIVGGVGHVEGRAGTSIGDLWRLWATFYAFRVTSAFPAP